MRRFLIILLLFGALVSCKKSQGFVIVDKGSLGREIITNSTGHDLTLYIKNNQMSKEKTIEIKTGETGIFELPGMDVNICLWSAETATFTFSDGKVLMCTRYGGQEQDSFFGDYRKEIEMKSDVLGGTRYEYKYYKHYYDISERFYSLAQDLQDGE